MAATSPGSPTAVPACVCGPPACPSGKVARDERVAVDRARGLRWSTIARRHQISERHARELWKQRLDTEPLERLDGTEAIAEALVQVEQVIEDFALLSEATRHDAVRLGALRSRMAALGVRVSLLRLGGYLPFTPRAAMVEADIRRMGADVVRVLERHAVADAVVDDLLEALRAPAAGSNGHGG
jgi:hypothetical protein